MVIFETARSFIAFIVVSIAILGIIYVFDEPIRAIEDRIILRIKSTFHNSRKESEDDV